MNGYGVRRQAKRDAACPLTQKRRRASLAAALHNFVSAFTWIYASPPWISDSPYVGCYSLTILTALTLHRFSPVFSVCFSFSGRKLPSSQQATKLSVTVFNSSQRA